MIDVSHRPGRCAVEVPDLNARGTAVSESFATWREFRNRHEAEAAAQAEGLTHYRLRVLA